MRGMSLRSVVLVYGLLVGGLGRDARAEDQVGVDSASFLGAIKRLYGQLDYEQAFNQIQTARRHPRVVQDEVQLSIYEGLILYELGKLSASGMSFRAALLLRPNASLPELVAPKVEAICQ